MTDHELTQKVIGCAMKVHSALGPNLLESAYQECLCYELLKAGLVVEKQKPMPLVYSEVRLDCGYRVDIMVERRLILEIKSVEAINDIHLAQVLTYLKLADCRLGLILNFNVLHLREGIKRVVNRYDDSTCTGHGGKQYRRDTGGSSDRRFVGGAAPCPLRKPQRPLRLVLT